MSCPKTVHLLQEYFSGSLSAEAREEFDKHLVECGECRAELNYLQQSRRELLTWQDQRVPHWNRGLELFRREHGVEPKSRSWFAGWQWVPTAASFVMLCLLLLDISVSVSDSRFEIAFGGSPNRAEIDQSLAAFEAQQIEEIESLIWRLEARQASNNIQLLQAVMEQTQQSTAESLDRIYAYFEEQRMQDLQDMQLGYQQLADSDYATLRSLQELAQYVSFRDVVR